MPVAVPDLVAEVLLHRRHLGGMRTESRAFTSAIVGDTDRRILLGRWRASSMSQWPLCVRDIWMAWQPNHEVFTSTMASIRFISSTRASGWPRTVSSSGVSHAVAVAVHRGDQVVAQLAAQLVHVHGDGVALDGAVAAVHRLSSCWRVTTRPPRSIISQERAVLVVAERDGLVVPGDLAARRVEAHRLAGEHGRDAAEARRSTARSRAPSSSGWKGLTR